MERNMINPIKFFVFLSANKLISSFLDISMPVMTCEILSLFDEALNSVNSRGTLNVSLRTLNRSACATAAIVCPGCLGFDQMSRQPQVGKEMGFVEPVGCGEARTASIERPKSTVGIDIEQTSRQHM